MSETFMPRERPLDSVSRRVRESRGIAASVSVDGTGALRDLRAAILATGAAAGLAEQRVMDMALAANELATNALIHGGGSASVQITIEGGVWSCDVVDDGPGLTDPDAGTQPPGVQEGGFGLWIARRLADKFVIVPSARGLHVRVSAFAETSAH